jgi:ribosomal-protein-alanine N-acetyltransferase
MALKIDPLTGPDDIDEVLRVEQASFANPWTREMYLAELEHRGTSYCYIAREDDGEAVGFCSFWRILDELHINNLAVLPEKRRSGIATALLKFVMHEGARLGAQRATLEVRRSNEVARRLYEQFGFAVDVERRAYYTHPVEDALVLWREQLGD